MTDNSPAIYRREQRPPSVKSRQGRKNASGGLTRWKHHFFRPRRDLVVRDGRHPPLKTVGYSLSPFGPAADNPKETPAMCVASRLWLEIGFSDTE